MAHVSSTPNEDCVISTPGRQDLTLTQQDSPIRNSENPKPQKSIEFVVKINKSVEEIQSVRN
jgi:hypothetical protein